jgi:nitrate/nitrite transporter NarK
LIASVLLKGHFWIYYVFLCFAIQGTFAAIAPLWAIPSETLPRNVMALVIGLVNACGNLGGFFGQAFVGQMKKQTGDVVVPFAILGVCMVIAACLSFLLPKTPKRSP